MLVLAIGLLGLAGITVVVLRSNMLSQQISEATNLTTSLMETLKREGVRSTVVPCPNASRVTYTTGTCPILESSSLSAAWVPSPDATCALPNVITTNTRSYDAVTANFIDLGMDGAFCTTFNTLRAGQYVRYYRVECVNNTESPCTTRVNERRLRSVVLFRDRFNKWRHVKLETIGVVSSGP